MRRHLLRIGKWAWLAAVLAVAAFLVVRARHDIAAMLRQLSWPMLAASVALTAAAKAGLVENARVAASRNGIALDFAHCARLYNLSQLGKYLPGSIWQFVGRAAAYRETGAAYSAIRDALLVESLWIVAAAAAVGVLLAGPGIVAIAASGLAPLLRWWLAGLASAGVLALAVLAWWKRPLLLRYLRLAVPPARVIAAQAYTWLLLGLAFWVLARACGLDVPPLFAIGLFAAGYAVGFLVPFAPAGLGVRDGILTLGLLPYLPPGEALVVTVLARLVYLVVDVGLVALQEPLLAALRWRARSAR